MRGALNTYQANGRRYFRPDMTTATVIQAVGSVGAGVVHARPMGITATIDSSATLTLNRIRPMPLGVSAEITVTVPMANVRLAVNQLFMRREKQGRYMRKEVDK